MVLGDGVLADGKGVYTIVPEGGDRYVGQSATLERMLTTKMLQCLVKGGVVLIPKLSSPRNTSYWGSRKTRSGSCVRCQLVEPWPLLQEAGCWAVMAEKWGVEDLENKGAHAL